MVSLGFSLTRGALGLVAVAFIYAVGDQLVLGELWPLALEWQLNGTYLSLWYWLMISIPVVVTAAYLLGLIVQAHISRDYE